jgi:hypothetical protein
MKPVSLRNLVSAIGLAVALVTAIAVPGIYLINAYLHTAQDLTFMARLNADRLAKYIYMHDTFWPYQQIRLIEHMTLPTAGLAPIHQKLHTADGDLVLEDGPPLAAPLITRRVPIVVAGSTRGYLEMALSFRDDLNMLAVVAALSLLGGAGIYFVPLRSRYHREGDGHAEGDLRKRGMCCGIPGG